jgi:IS5 family transposase
MLVLQQLYNLSDEKVVLDASLNLAYMYFLGINPDDDLPHPSLLTKFRKNKLEGNLTVDEVIAEVVRQCMGKGILEGSRISIDTTHTEANTFKCTAERVMKRLAKKVFKTVEKECGEVPEEINQEIPNYKEIENHKEAKAYIPVSEMAYKIDEDLFGYIKDSDEWFCVQGNHTVRKYHKKGRNRESYRYYVEKEQC